MKPQNQSVAIAYSMMKKAKEKKMAQGGAVTERDLIGHKTELKPPTEPEEYNRPHSLLGDENEEEMEPEQHYLKGKGFSANEIDDHSEEEDAFPGMFAQGGVAEQGEYAGGKGVHEEDVKMHGVHPLEHMLKTHLMKKMAMRGYAKGGDVTDDEMHEEMAHDLVYKPELDLGTKQVEADAHDKARAEEMKKFLLRHAMMPRTSKRMLGHE